MCQSVFLSKCRFPLFDNSSKMLYTLCMAGKKHLDKRQQDFIVNYFAPESPTYLNAYRSALACGYKEQYAENITSLMPKWLSEQLEYKDRVIIKAKRRLEEFIDEKADKRVASDMVKFTLKTLGKDEGFTERTEQTTKNLHINVDISDSEFQQILKAYRHERPKVVPIA